MYKNARVAAQACEAYAVDGKRCPHCFGKGWVWVQNGPDDVDRELCECADLGIEPLASLPNPVEDWHGQGEEAA